MKGNKFFGIFVFVWLYALLVLHGQSTEACSCMPSHPQTHFCSADYVAIIRVRRRSQRVVANKIAYKIDVKKSYKMNEVAQRMFRHGRILTADNSAACGANLDVGKLYLIAGRAPHLNLCSYIKEYQKMSGIERRGFSGVYRKGCKCQVKPCFGNECLRERESQNHCKWSPFAKCETDFSACVPLRSETPEGVISKCHWQKTMAYKKCMSDP